MNQSKPSYWQRTSKDFWKKFFYLLAIVGLSKAGYILGFTYSGILLGILLAIIGGALGISLINLISVKVFKYKSSDLFLRINQLNEKNKTHISIQKDKLNFIIFVSVLCVMNIAGSSVFLSSTNKTDQSITKEISSAELMENNKTDVSVKHPKINIVNTNEENAKGITTQEKENRPSERNNKVIRLHCIGSGAHKWGELFSKEVTTERYYEFFKKGFTIKTEYLTSSYGDVNSREFQLITEQIATYKINPTTIFAELESEIKGERREIISIDRQTGKWNLLIEESEARAGKQASLNANGECWIWKNENKF